MQFPSAEQFDTYYEDHLKKKLREVDSLRKKIILNYTIIAIVIFSGFVFEAVTWMLLGIAFIVIFVFWYTNRYGISFQYFDRQHHRQIIENIAVFIYSGFVYDHDRYLKLKDVRNGLLISGEPKQFSGSDYIEAQMGSINFQSSSIHSFSNEKDAAGMQVYHSHFSGLAAVVPLRLSVAGAILVVNESSLQESLKQFQAKSSHIVIEDTFFTNYSDEAAFYKYFTPSVWLLIKNYTESTQSKIIISIQSAGICIGIPMQQPKNYLRSELLTTVVTKDAAGRYFRDLLFMIQFCSAIEKIHLASAESLLA